MRMLQPLLACLRTRPPLRWEISTYAPPSTPTSASFSQHDFLPEFVPLSLRSGVLLVEILLDIFHVNYLEYPLNCMCLPCGQFPI
jgi:hypothetical protein